uniref:C2H2-type domain-containing protein n=1 Tax=Panagrolaimus sp. JU765 TaxID=591449 RepID=A0AC34QDW2_9BILA
MEMTINHGNHLQHHYSTNSNSGIVYQNRNNYSTIKYEPIESISSCENQNVISEFISNTQHQMTHDSPKSFFDYEFFDSPESLSNARMNGVIHSVSQGGGTDPAGLNNIPRPSRSSDDQSSNGDETVNGIKLADKRQIKGRSNNIDRKRPYPCNKCPSKFGSKMELEEHQNSHTGQKPFECEVCNSRFNRRSTLWNHKRIHSDAKPFQCSVCNMQFKWKNSLKCHKEMHVRKNETTVAVDNEIKQLTYATAAKRRLLIMQAICNSETDQSFGQNDLRTNHQHHNSSIFGMDDPSKMLSGSLLDIKDSLSLQSPVNNGTSSIFPFFKPIINVNVNVDLNHLNSLNDNPHLRHSGLPTINHFSLSSSQSGSIDYSSNHDSTNGNHFHLHHPSSTATSTSSTSSSSNGHHRHLNTDMSYQQAIDHSLLLNTSQHGNDYMNAFDYMMPSAINGSNNYANVDLPLSALAGNNDHLTDHGLISPNTSRMMLYHGIEHHPNCMNSQMSAGQLR